MFRVLIALCLLATTWNVANAECANACNGHGRCTSYDMCICNRNWQAADCSERVCQFGLAHVDTPKGDLDGSGTVTNANEVVIENNYVYPYGTTEQFPQMQTSDLETLSDTAHFYMECSNKGRCDRASGECQCFDGYDGVACQRASCPGYPNSCSGHGVCKTIEQLAASDNGNIYKLWDRKATMGCECDAGYFGPDCSQRECKYGVDPLYLDDAATIKYSIWDFAVLSTRSNATSFSQLFSNGEFEKRPGYWAIRFYDSFGEDWLTEPIVAGATCAQVVTALENIPNDVVPKGTVKCTLTSFLNGTENTFTESPVKLYYDAQEPTYRLHYKMAIWEARTGATYGELSQYTPIQAQNSSYETQTTKLSGYIYRLKFYGNPGALQQPDIEVHLDGTRPTLISKNAKVITKVWTDGQQGEYSDYFADYCDGVTVTLGTVPTGQTNAGQSFLTGFSLAEKNLLKKCLGDSDYNVTNNIDVYNWDKGTKYFPHLVKLVRTVTTYNDGGYYAALWYDTTAPHRDNTGAEGTFYLLNPIQEPDVSNAQLQTDNYNIYTTKGTLELTSVFSELTVSFASKYFFTTNTTYDIWRTDATSSNFFDGDLSCEGQLANGISTNYLPYCLNKGDIFTYFNWEYPQYNPPYINLYTAERLYTGPYEYTANYRFYKPTGAHTNTLEMHYQTHMITTDISSNWGVSVGGTNPNVAAPSPAHFHVYKFEPAAASTYNYVAECANRGICDRDAGLCKCFPGYTSDACELQSSLAV
mmetsp:Transcript_13220/g.14298  ORF Transcript_13220/g.14298 Transcript_13220/m.14298 type:complete len:757 (+) Transcript_13220:76-2346(+)|eukprot:gene8193-8863_t